ncbi:kinesin-like protein KIF16B isoform X2 [Antennarius striatus]|uniref:kinesin-like protein KIF16B isoform X2 n=1 Tax=Antennarius striatus TaxID=241820 RepID=UPI0035AD7D1C
MASVRVAVRVRPMNRREKDLTARCIIRMEGTKTSITNLKVPDGLAGDSTRERVKTFTYDFSYDSMDSKSSAFVSQETVFRDLGSDVLRSAFQGYNACVFAYGQTGSGKSYTMMGTPGDAGLIPRFCEGLFSRIADATRWDKASFRTEVSYLEIYNERVRDLLRRKSTQTYNLRVREHPKDGPYVEDLSKHLVQNYGDVEELMEAGNLNRTTASTGMNDVSSRSHAIFTINFTQAKFDAEMPSETVSKIHLVDLAGSERADATGATGVRLKEGGNINKSLVTLGNVISSLADLSQDGAGAHLRKRAVFVPYRDSVLTWLLKDSLGGNSKTIMIATVSPADVNYGETLSTLRYANRAKNIINKPTINEDGNVRLIRELRAEIARLKALLVQGNQIALLDSPTALSMEEKLHQNEARVLELTKEWTNKWNETQNILKEETLALRKEGIGVVLDSELPHLIGIDDDLLSTGIILYHLKEGRTYVGREDASSEQDITLHGLDLESEHCMFQNQNGKVTLVPMGGAQCSVNGVQVTAPSQLNQGAVILLGRTNMFRFNHPKEAARLREKRKSGLLSSLSLSMTDLSQSCENLSAVMLYNPGLEFERQQREELEKLERKRTLIKEMEAKHQSEKAELERLQQEVESQRKESEEVQQRILRQEENLRCRSRDIESRLQDFLAEKERFEEERRLEVQGAGLQQRGQQQEAEEEERRRQQEATEQTEIYLELERLQREREEQAARLGAERRRLEEQEREQLSLVGRLEEQLREKQEVAAAQLTGDHAHRLEEERHALSEIREELLCAKEAGQRPDVGGASEEARSAQERYTSFKEAQVKELTRLEEELRLQKEELEKEVTAERGTLLLLARGPQEEQEAGLQEAAALSQEEQLLRQAEHRLQVKERQLARLAGGLLPALAEEKLRAEEVLERRAGGRGPPSLDNTLYQVEKELEDKEEKLELRWRSAQQLQQLQDSYQFTANVARQEDKVRRKERQILEGKEKQQREALERAVARLERRHCALRRSVSMETETEEQRRRRTGPDLDQHRVEQEIQKLRQRISGEEKTGSPLSHTQSLNALLPLSDDRINAYIEEEVQRRMKKMNLLNGGSADLYRSSDSLREEAELSDGSSVRGAEQDEENLRVVNPRRLKYENAFGLWSSLPPSPELEASHVLENKLTEPEIYTLKLHEGKSPDPPAGDEETPAEAGLEIPRGLFGQAVSDTTRFCVSLANATIGRFNTKNVAYKEQCDCSSCVPDKKLERMVQEEPFSNQSSKFLKSVSGFIKSKLKSKESLNDGVKPEAGKVTSDGSYHLGYFTAKLSEVYRNIGQRLQDTQDIIQNVRVDDMKEGLFQYVGRISKDLPSIHRAQLELDPEPGTKVHLLKDRTLGTPHRCSISVDPGITGWPEGSVLSVQSGSFEVFCQRLVHLSPSLSRLQTLSSQQMLQELESLAPQVQVDKLLSVFWLEIANCRFPTPRPGCLLLSEEDLIVLSTDANHTLAIFHHFSRTIIKKVQISLAGQHVRLTGGAEDTVLAIFTYSKDLTQEFCKAFLKAVSPEGFSRGIESSALLSGDLMALSLDWTSTVPDIILDTGLHITSRFKRVLADLLYIVHGNMDGPGKPSLANVCPLLYTSVKVMNSALMPHGAIFQFLLTDTHVALLCEDGVFHPVPRGSSLVPSQPQFRGLEVRQRSEIRCLLVRQRDSWLVVDVTFSARNANQKTASSSRGSVDSSSVSHHGHRSDTWKLAFGCTSEAVTLINHLCTQDTGESSFP